MKPDNSESARRERLMRPSDCLSSDDLERVGLGYTLATGRMFCSFATLQEYAEDLMGESVFTHEFADRDLWGELRVRFEARVMEANQ